MNRLEAAKQTIYNNEPTDGIDRAEGLRHVLRLQQFASTSYEKDALHPGVARCPGAICKIGFDSPDQTQISVNPLSPPYTYRVYGNLNSIDFSSWQLLTPVTFQGPSMSSDQLVVDADRNYEIFLGAGFCSPQQPTCSCAKGPNCFYLPPNGGQLILRAIYGNWSTEIEPSVQVEVLDVTDYPPVPTLTPVSFYASGIQTGATLNGVLNSFSTLPFNLFLLDMTGTGSGAFPALGTPLIPGLGAQDLNLQTHGKYNLPLDKAIIVVRTPEDIRSGNIQLANRWLESLDYSSRLVSYNMQQSYQDSDGNYRYVISHEDPGVANWLDTRDHAEGTILLRYLWPTDVGSLIEPTYTVVPLDEVWNYMPADHPFVGQAERNAVLKARNAGVNRRHNPAGLGAFADSDGDGEANSTDACPGTPPGAEVDGDGCSIQQFCAKYNGQVSQCMFADFKNDEPVGSPNDCKPNVITKVCQPK